MIKITLEKYCLSPWELNGITYELQGPSWVYTRGVLEGLNHVSLPVPYLGGKGLYVPKHQGTKFISPRLLWTIEMPTADQRTTLKEKQSNESKPSAEACKKLRFTPHYSVQYNNYMA